MSGKFSWKWEEILSVIGWFDECSNGLVMGDDWGRQGPFMEFEFSNLRQALVLFLY